MKKVKIYILAIFLPFIMSSCGTIKEGFSSQKKNSSDEFLVEKKSPLAMPPNFDELPIPNTNETQTNENSNSIKSIISSNKDSVLSTQNNETNQNLESSILKKIKKN